MANIKSNEFAGYHQFNPNDDPYGSFEVFYWSEDDIADAKQHDGAELEEGWYWWACFPGCMPDADPIGPFATSRDAHDDAQNFD